MAKKWFVLLAGVLLACTSAAQRERALALEQAASALIAAHPQLPLARGQRIFAAQCAVCHQADGGGTKNAIPPLAGHVPYLLRAEGGRAYLSRLILYGASGPIEVLGQLYHNQMPSLGALLKDDDVVAVLAWAAMAWGNDAITEAAPLVTSQEVAAARLRPQRPQVTLSKRPVLAQ